MAELQTDAIFQAIKDRVAADPAKAKSVNGVFLYKITKDGKVAKEWSKYSAKVKIYCRIIIFGEVQRLLELSCKSIRSTIFIIIYSKALS